MSLVADCGREKLDLRNALIHFDNWMEKYRLSKFVRFVKDNDYMSIRCLNRFMEDYKRAFGRNEAPAVC